MEWAWRAKVKEGPEKSKRSRESWLGWRGYAVADLTGMLISYRHRFIFVHVPRTGGSSVRRALEAYADGPGSNSQTHVAGGSRNALPPSMADLSAEGHVAAAVIREALPPEVFSRSFKFAFVRNTWDRLVSRYCFITQTPQHPAHRTFLSFNGFDDWITMATSDTGKPQKDLLADGGGNLLVDFVGRFEKIGTHFRLICERIGVPAALPHRKASDRRDYRTYYTDHTAAMVAGAFGEEIEFFGFTFDSGAKRES